MKKLLLLLATTCLLFMLFLFSASAEQSVLHLPSSLILIDESAFEGIATETVKLPKGLEEIGSRAFADTPRLRSVWIPKSVLSIEEDAFENSSDILFFGEEGSYAQQWARSQRRLFIPLNLIAIVVRTVAIAVILWLVSTRHNEERGLLCGGYRNVEHTIIRKRRMEMYPLALDFP